MLVEEMADEPLRLELEEQLRDYRLLCVKLGADLDIGNLDGTKMTMSLSMQLDK